MTNSQTDIAANGHKLILEIGCGSYPFFMAKGIYSSQPKVCEYGLLDHNDHYIGIDTPETITKATWNQVSPGEQKRIRAQFHQLKFGSAQEAINTYLDKGVLRGHYEFLEASGTDIPLPSLSVDRVVLKNVVGAPSCHFIGQDKRSLLNIFLEALRLLKTSGDILVIEDDTPQEAYHWLALLDYYHGHKVLQVRRRMIEESREMALRSPSFFEFRISFKKALMELTKVPMLVRCCLSNMDFLRKKLDEADLLIWGQTFRHAF